MILLKCVSILLKMGFVISEHYTSLAVGCLISIGQLKYCTDESTITIQAIKNTEQNLIINT